MFNVKGEVLQQTVTALVKGAKKARLGEKACFIKTEGSFVSFYFNGDDLQVEKKIEAVISGDLSIATGMAELELKVSALPSDEEITVELEGTLLNLRWGRSSKITCETIAETAPLIEVPAVVEYITWKPGLLHTFARGLTPFAAKTGTESAKRYPCTAGINFSKDSDIGEVSVKVGNGYLGTILRSESTEWFDELNLSIPTESLQGLSDILPSDCEVSVGINESRTLLIFQAGLTTAVSRLLVGNFPPIERFCADVNNVKTKWTFDRMELIDLCKRVRTLAMTSASGRAVLYIKSEGAKVTAKSENSVLVQQVGAMVEGNAFEFGMNAHHVELAASLFRTEEVQILFEHDKSPLTIVCEETDHIKVFVGQMQR
ncbi:hypothetical protein [Bacillus sp. FJAT-29937]|uniref:hypothetical protein n=1 Tax=Bacillus sp. FJAT-29937 TaxID=1720553 RepID=UPI00083531F1|nr:hypothetical protein [Bacillus sp. FJAT-29937]